MVVPSVLTRLLSAVPEVEEEVVVSAEEDVAAATLVVAVEATPVAEVAMVVGEEVVMVYIPMILMATRSNVDRWRWRIRSFRRRRWL